jgi:ferrochelatase
MRAAEPGDSMLGSDVSSGVLLVNLGSPRAPTPPAVREYLSEFLADPDVVDLPRWLWLPLLRGVVLPIRSKRSAQLYAKIWTPDGSPLIEISKRQRDALARELARSHHVALAMRYGEPSIESALRELAARGCRGLTLVPMFPQWSRSTNGSVEKAVRRAVEESGAHFELRIARDWGNHEGYVGAVAEGIRAASRGLAVEHTVLSFHGLPARAIERGDPYRDQCAATAEGVARRLGLERAAWTMAFQSRFGPARWIEPYTVDVLRSLAPRCPRVLIACPGFVADCLETLEEVGIRLAESFREAGGAELVVAPCVDESPAWIRALADIVRETEAASAPGPRCRR